MTKTMLPSKFEEFEDVRKQGFGGIIAGWLCSYTPLELLDAAGIAAVGLCGTSNETVQDAERVLPKNLCPLIKSTYGFAYTEKCPYTYFSDIIIGETTCDGKKKMYELLSELKETHIMHLPQSQERSYSKDIWYEEVKILKETLENKFGAEITDEKLRNAVKLRNKLKAARCELYQLQESCPPAMMGTDMMLALQRGTFHFNTNEYIDEICALVAQKKKEQKEGTSQIDTKLKRILITGCPTGGLIKKVGSVIEDNGGVIVCLDDCSGERTNSHMIDEKAEDIQFLTTICQLTVLL